MALPARNPSTDQAFARRLVAALAAGFMLLLALGLAGAVTLRLTQLHGELSSRAMTVENTLHQLSAVTERIENARRGYLLSGDPRFPQWVEDLAAESGGLLAQARRLVEDDGRQQERLEALADFRDRHLASVRGAIEARAAGLEAGQGLFADDGVPLLQEMRALSRATVAYEQTLVAQSDAEQQRSQTAAYIVLGVAGLLLIVVAGATFWIVRRNLAELRRSRNVLRGMNEMLEGAVQVRTADLQRANAEIQRFAYIVSHDLRSPLVNVMGFTSELDAATGELRSLVERVEEKAPELLSEEARLAVREDLPEAIGFIRSSTQKMDRLINAILRLSREGRRVISPEPLDMDGLVRSIVDTLQHRLGETDSTVTIEGTLPTIVSDRVAVEQIFSNLIENAVKYLKPNVPGRIVLRGRRVGPRVQFEVEDNGRGIDPKDHERVFDLFRRSGAQDRPGEGIGLAHVRAMAYRLGGTVSCQSALDEGATFRLSIPETYEETKEG